MDFMTEKEIADSLSQYIGVAIGSGLSFGFLLGTALEFLGYGVFKALSLLNIK